MRKLIIILLLLAVAWPNLSAQVINTERIRFAPTAKRWTGNFDFNFGLNRTKAGQTLRLNTNGKLQLNYPREKWMLLSGYALVQFLDIDTPDAVPKNFNNTQFVHLRYNRSLHPKLTWEAFAQEQWDEVHEIDLRLLFGTGPRVQFVQTDSSQFFFGLLYMYEHENTSGEDFLERNRDHRLSSYLSLGFEFNNFLINHISYYQPNLQNFGDYRINSETSIRVQIDKRLSLRTSFELIFDSQPPPTVRQTRYNLNSGISFEF